MATMIPQNKGELRAELLRSLAAAQGARSALSATLTRVTHAEASVRTMTHPRHLMTALEHIESAVWLINNEAAGVQAVVEETTQQPHATQNDPDGLNDQRR